MLTQPHSQQVTGNFQGLPALMISTRSERMVIFEYDFPKSNFSTDLDSL